VHGRLYAHPTSGPQANALAAVASKLAELGNIDRAFQAETRLEAEPRDILAPRRDAALKAIAVAQKRAGDLEGSLATALRINQPQLRLERLRALAAKQPST
jgi:hypothetical protein